MNLGADQALILRLGQSLASLPLTIVVETLRPLPCEPVAGAPEFVLGLSVIRGEPIPVVDLTRLVSGRPGTPTRFAVVKVGERRVALAVDGIVGVRPIAKEGMQQLPPLLAGSSADAVTAVGTLDRELFMVLQASRVIPDSMGDQMPDRLAS